MSGWMYVLACSTILERVVCVEETDGSLWLMKLENLYTDMRIPEFA